MHPILALKRDATFSVSRGKRRVVGRILLTCPAVHSCPRTNASLPKVLLYQASGIFLLGNRPTLAESISGKHELM